MRDEFTTAVLLEAEFFEQQREFDYNRLRKDALATLAEYPKLTFADTYEALLRKVHLGNLAIDGAVARLTRWTRQEEME